MRTRDWRLVLALLAGAAAAAPPVVTKEQLAADGKGNLLWLSELITRKTPGHAVDLDVEIKGATHLSLAVTEGGDSFACDHTDWLDARLVGPAGVKQLTDLNWSHAATGWGQVAKNRSPAGSPMVVDGKRYDNGIGVHSPGILIFKLPAGYARFQARVGLDESGTKQGGGSTIQAAVFAGLPTPKQLSLLGLAAIPDLAYQERMADLTARVGPGAASEFVQLAQDLVRRNWTHTFHGGIADARLRAKQSCSDEALLKETDRDPVDVVLRRTRALWRDLSAETDLRPAGERLAALEAANAKTEVTDLTARLALFDQATALRREIAFANPLLRGMDRILFITRDALPPDEYNGGNHMCDQFFGFHATVRGKSKGTGLFVLEQPFGKQPTVRNLLADATLADGRYKGRKLDFGGFLSPDLSYDAKQILFAWTEGKSSRGDWRSWTPESCFHLFRVNADGTGLTQLTDGEVNDFDPCWLPNGRVAFISERRGGFGRCHGRPVPSFTLHSMLDDGSDIVRFSPHETNEWQPSVDNNGMIIYTRWDYVDRGFNQAHHAWITYPDGRDARGINGNTHASERTAPHMEMQLRAVPNSPLLAGIASGHHTESRGSIILIDPRIRDDNAMSQLKRVTPDQLFPEAEFYHYRGSGAYATPWPLSERYFLCVYDHDANAQYNQLDADARRYALCLLDIYGNKEILYRNSEISCLDPIPLRPRAKPPVIPNGTLVGAPRQPDGSKPAAIPVAELPKTAKVGCVNVYDSLRPLPAGVKITALRIWQVLPKSTPIADNPRIGHGSQKPAKACLGTVPVEDDGSAYWEQPVGVPVLYHAVDELGLAVQGMRSATYVQPGETLMCTGCHNQRVTTTKSRQARPKAMQREPSTITPEADGTNPFNYPRLVQPLLDAKCVDCHAKNADKRAPDLGKGDFAKNPSFWYTSFIKLRPYVAFYDSASWVEPYTIPGRFGARASKLYQLLSKGHHDVKLTPDEWRRLGIWLDSNCLFYGHEKDLLAQASGKVVQASLY